LTETDIAMTSVAGSRRSILLEYYEWSLICVTVDLNEKFECTVDFNSHRSLQCFGWSFHFQSTDERKSGDSQEGAIVAGWHWDFRDQDSTDIVSVRLEVGAINLLPKMTDRQRYLIKIKFDFYDDKLFVV